MSQPPQPYNPAPYNPSQPNQGAPAPYNPSGGAPGFNPSQPNQGAPAPYNPSSSAPAPYNPSSGGTPSYNPSQTPQPYNPTAYNPPSGTSSYNTPNSGAPPFNPSQTNQPNQGAPAPYNPSSGTPSYNTPNSGAPPFNPSSGTPSYNTPSNSGAPAYNPSSGTPSYNTSNSGAPYNTGGPVFNSSSTNPTGYYSNNNSGFSGPAPGFSGPNNAPGYSGPNAGYSAPNSGFNPNMNQGYSTNNNPAFYSNNNTSYMPPPAHQQPYQQQPFTGKPGKNQNNPKRNKDASGNWQWQPCKYYAQGHCQFGDACHFQHGNQDKRTKPVKPRKNQGQGGGSTSTTAPSTGGGITSYIPNPLNLFGGGGRDTDPIIAEYKRILSNINYIKTLAMQLQNVGNRSTVIITQHLQTFVNSADGADQGPARSIAASRAREFLHAVLLWIENHLNLQPLSGPSIPLSNLIKKIGESQRLQQQDINTIYELKNLGNMGTHTAGTGKDVSQKEFLAITEAIPKVIQILIVYLTAGPPPQAYYPPQGGPNNYGPTGNSGYSPNYASGGPSGYGGPSFGGSMGGPMGGPMKPASWSWLNGQNYVAYDPQTSMMIENGYTAWCSGQNQGGGVTVNIKGMSYFIDFQNMKQVNAQDPKKTRQVQRG